MANDHTYYVGESGVLSHNVSCNPTNFKIDGIFPFHPKPKIHTNPKHVKGGAGNRRNAGIQPSDSFVSFDKYALFDGKHWWAAGTNGALYRYSKTSDGLYHWSGSTKGSVPLDIKRAPSQIRKLFGVD